MDLVEVKNRKAGDDARHPWELARFEVVRSLLSPYMKKDGPLNVLDIGCGDIFFITKLSLLYPNANFYAIDIAFTDEMIASMKPATAGKNIFLFKSLEEANMHLKSSADVVLLLDVVEHIEKDREFLSLIKANPAITTSTLIAITVPAFQNLFCSHDHFLGHYRRYTNQTLLETIEASGLRKVSMGYFFLSLIPPRIVQVAGEKIRKPKDQTTGLVGWNRGKLVTGVFKGILLMDYAISKFVKKISGLSLPGLSNYILCKKPA